VTHSKKADNLAFYQPTYKNLNRQIKEFRYFDPKLLLKLIVVISEFVIFKIARFRFDSLFFLVSLPINTSFIILII
jgi:hypothetical protein